MVPISSVLIRFEKLSLWSHWTKQNGNLMDTVKTGSQRNEVCNLCDIQLARWLLSCLLNLRTWTSVGEEKVYPYFQESLMKFSMSILI